MMTSNQQKRVAEERAKKKALVDKHKAATEQRKKNQEIAKEKAAKVTEAAKDKKALAKADSASAAKKKKEDERTQAAEKVKAMQKQAVSPRTRQGKRGTTSSNSSVTSTATQGGHNKSKLAGPPDIKKNLNPNFKTAIGLEGQFEGDVTVGTITKGVYQPKDLERGSDSGRSIIDDAKFATESVDMDFSKDNFQRGPLILLHKVQDKMLSCSTTSEDLDAIRFLTIIENFKYPTLDTSLAKTVFH